MSDNKPTVGLAAFPATVEQRYSDEQDAEAAKELIGMIAEWRTKHKNSRVAATAIAVIDDGDSGFRSMVAQSSDPISAFHTMRCYLNHMQASFGVDCFVVAGNRSANGITIIPPKGEMSNKAAVEAYQCLHLTFVSGQGNG